MVDATVPRVALLGNVANCLLPIALALREAGIHADLFVDDAAPAVSRPENVDRALASAAWIKRGRWFPAWSALVPWLSPVVRSLREYDLVVVSGAGPIYAQWSRRPWCWWVSGHDLTVAPFPWVFRSTYPTWRRRAAAFPLALWQRRAARRAHRIWVQPFAPFQEAIRQLQLSSPPVASAYLPLSVTPGLVPPADPGPDLAAILDRMARADLAVFHPSRMMMDSSYPAQRSGQWKGNDRLLRGLAELSTRRPELDVVLVAVDSPSSRDTRRARALTSELGIDERVLWARPAASEAFDRSEMAAMYEASDVVAVEFASGWFGNVVLEGLAMGRPVVSGIDEDPMAVLYPSGHPIISAFEPAAIARALEDLVDPARRAEVGEAGLQWIEAHHTPAVTGRRYVSEVSAALRRA